MYRMDMYMYMYMYIMYNYMNIYYLGPVLNAWFNDCVLRILPTLRI